MKKTINSSMISALEWADGTLTITWSKGNTTSYPNVPEQVYHDFSGAESAGKYYHSKFKGQYSAA